MKFFRRHTPEMTRPRILLCLAIGSALFVAKPMRAVDLTWDGDSSLFFNTAGNWDPNQTPTGNDDLFFNVDTGGGAIIVGNSFFSDMQFSDFDWEFTGEADGTLTSTNGSVRIDDPLGTSLASGTNVAMTNGLVLDMAGDFYVGQQGFGGLSIETTDPLMPTQMRSRDVYIGQDAGSTGQITVTGVGSSLTTDGTAASNGYFVGLAGNGTLNVTNGGLARILNDTTDGIADLELGVLATGNGTLNIDGPGSRFIGEDSTFGEEGTATVNITGGGELLQNIGPSPDADVAGSAGSAGNITVNGDGSRWQAERIVLGNGGDATLSVEAGGNVRSDDDEVILGFTLGSSGRVAVFGGSGADRSSAEVVNDLRVGSGGLGELFIGRDLNGNSDGNGLITISGDLRVGDNGLSPEENLVVVDGPGAVANIGDVAFVGENGKGTLEVRNGGLFNADRPRFGSSADSEGTLLVTGAGSVLTARTNFVIATRGTGNATVESGGRLDANGNFWVGFGSDSQGTLVIDSGTVNAGLDNTGTLFIGGDNDGTSGGTGSITVQNGGVLSSAIDNLLGGNSTAAGTLTVTGPGSFANLRDNSANNDDVTTIGSVGGGIVNVNGGGRLDAEAIFLNSTSGNTQDAELNVDGTGTVVNIDGGLVVGNQGLATVVISGGAQVNTSLNPDANITNRRLIVGNGASSDGSSLTLTGAGTRLDYFSNERISVGLNGGSTSTRALLEVLDGAVLNAVQRDGNGDLISTGFVVVGDEANGNGQINVDGVGSRLEARYLDVGQSTNASGLVNITGGGVIALTQYSEIGAFGTGNSVMNVSGTGSRFEPASGLSVGAGGVGTNGTLNVSDGGTVENSAASYIGRFSGSNGTVNIGGAGETAAWNLGDNLILAGDRTAFSDSGSQTSGSATLNVLANGVVSVADSLYLKDRGVINLNGGELAADDLVFQDSATRTGTPTVNFNSGTIRYTASKTLSAGDIERLFDGGPAKLTTGQHLAVDGTLMLDDELRIDGGELSIGTISPAEFQDHIDFDAGTLNLTNTGLVVTAAGLLGSVAVIDADETINVSTSVFVQDDGLINVGGGTLTMGGGAIGVGGTLVVAGGVVDFGNGLVNDGDIVLIDAATDGTLTNNADLTLVNTVLGGNFVNNASGTISIGLGDAGDADLLDLSGTASLAGTLDVSLADATGFTLGDEIDLLLADAGITGTFDDTLLPSLAGGLLFDVLYEANRVALQVVLADLPGDYNGDGIVDAADYTVWRDGGSPDSSQAGYDLWASNYGATAPNAPASSVPEPATGVLLLIAFAAAKHAPRSRF